MRKIASDPKNQIHFVHLEAMRSGERLKCFRCGDSEPISAFRTITEVARGSYQAGPHAVVFALHPMCDGCREARRDEFSKHPLYSRELKDFWRLALGSIRSGAKKRKIMVTIDHEDALDMFLRQAGRCAISDIEMNWQVRGGWSRGCRAHRLPSIDRIDSHGNYTAGNTHIVLQAINMMKQDMSMSAFIELCEVVASRKMTGLLAA